MAEEIPREQREAISERAVSELPFGHGSALWKYWTAGKGFAKWSGALHKWRTLRDLLLKAGVPAHSVDGLTTNIIMAVMPGYMKLAHAAGHRMELGVQMADEPASRADEQGPVPFVRSYPLQDISIRAGGDGRTVDAYAAVFDTPAQIHDADGDYIEVIDRRAFDRILTKIAPAGGRANWRCGVFYNHGMTLHATPSDRNSVPIGVPLEIRADEHGLFTRTRYHKGELADQILEAIREGSLSAYSFSGRFDRSSPRPPRGGFRPDLSGNLPAVRRTESTLREYGPTPFPAYADAAITGVRSEQIVEQLEHITELLRMGAPLDSPEEEIVSAAPEDRGSAPEDSPPARRSYRSIREQIQANTALLLQQQHRR